MSDAAAPDIGHEDFWYIPLNGDSSKLPSVKWGGYGQDFEAADEVYSHDQVVEYDHEHWGIVGIKGDGRSLLMFDIDIHKAPEDFDADLVTIPTEETLVVKSQNGGFHVWFVVDRGRGGGQESDFGMTYDLGFDIDIRGSYVKHHGVAPSDIPGVEGKYEVAQMGTEPPMTVFGPADATDRIRYLGDDSSEKDYGEALLEHTGGRSAGGTGDVSINIDRDVEPPEEMPTCYHRALQLRAANPDDPNVNTHKVNVLAGLCGLAAGYDVETMVGHFVDDYAPGNNADREETEYQLSHLARKMDGGEYAPPAISTLREYGVLDEDEVCRCSIEYHGSEGAGDSSSPPPALEDGNEGVEQNTDELWGYVRDCYRSDDDDDGWGGDRRKGRLYAAKTLEKTGSYMHTLESEQLWVYKEATGTFSPWGEQSIDRTLESRLGKFYSNSEKNEIVNRIKARNQTHREELNGGLHPSPLLSVGDGVVDLETGELHDHDPDHKFTRGLEWDYDAKRADKDAVLEFLDDVTKREEDRDTILDHLAHGLMPGHPYRAFLMLYGPGANGKTQIEQLFRGFVGPENAASVDLSEITDGEFATGALPGKFINFGDENSVGEIYDASDLKSLSGGGTMRANEKHEKQYDFENEAAMFFAANEPPRFAEDKDAIADRLYPIEMPYQFKSASEYEDDNPMHKRKVPGIAQDLLADESAMRGLLQLAVEHAQGLIETHGEYSMPEGPNERRLRYEGASDPIKRFLYECLVEGSRSDVIGKTDAYTVYSEMCDMHDERMAGEDTFKEEVTKQTIIDLEKFRTRKITPGEDKDTAWRYANFSDDAKLYMPSRLQKRYFGEADDADETEDADVDDDAESDELSDEGGTPSEDAVFNATPIAKAAESLTGYTTITAEIAAVTDMPGDNNGVKAVAKDASGAIDIVAWDNPFSSRLRAVEGEHVAIKYAEIGEYEDTRQLVPTEGLTEIETVQAGVGHTEGEPTTDGQAELAKTVGDGGVSAVPDDAIGSSPNAQRLHEILEGRSTTAPVSKGELIQKATNRFDMDLEQAADALETAVEKKGIIIESDDGCHPV